MRHLGVVGTNPDYVNTYTPTWSSTGTAPALVNGTLTGYYALSGKRLFVSIHLVPGSSTTFGTGNWSFTLPSGFTTAAVGHALAGIAYDNSLTNYSPVIAIVAASSTTVGPIATISGSAQVDVDSPFTWATSDSLILSGTVLIA